jgi:hypothetical protein
MSEEGQARAIIERNITEFYSGEAGSVHSVSRLEEQIAAALAQARVEGRRETWEAAAQVVEGHTNPYDAHDCAEQDCRPWIAQALRAKAKEGGI